MYKAPEREWQTMGKPKEVVCKRGAVIFLKTYLKVFTGV